MRQSRALMMRKTSESLLQTQENDGDEDDDNEHSKRSGKESEIPSSSFGGEKANNDLFCLVPGRIRELCNDSYRIFAVATWAERYWGLLSSHSFVRLVSFDLPTLEPQTYQFFLGNSDVDIPIAVSFCAPLIPLRQPSSSHESRSLDSTGTFAIAWKRPIDNSCYIRMYDLEETSNSIISQDWKWVSQNEFLSSVGIVSSVSFSPGGGHLIIGGETGLQLWNLETKLEAWRNETISNVSFVEFSPDGRLIASFVKNSKVIRIWWRSDASGGFGYLLLPHQQTIRKIEWRPRFSSSSNGSSQTLLVHLSDGLIRVWQESDVLEDFDFYTVCEMKSSRSSAFVGWIHYFAEYTGLLWLPPTSYRRSPAPPPVEVKGPSGKPQSTLPSNSRLWGGMEKGHGHTWFGESVFNHLESRLGSFPPQSNTRDWIISCDEDVIRVWAIEGLGEHARSGIRSQLWIEEKCDRPQTIQFGMASCRFTIPISLEVRSLPRVDEFFADNAPNDITILGLSETGSLGALSLSNDKGFSFQNRFLGFHTGESITVLASDDNLIVTVDSCCTLIQWMDGRAKEVVKLDFQVKLGTFLFGSEKKQLVLLNNDTKEVVFHDFATKLKVLVAPIEPIISTSLGLFSIEDKIYLVQEESVFVWDAEKNNIPPTRIDLNKTGASCTLSEDKAFIWIGHVGGSLSQFPTDSTSILANTESKIDPVESVDPVNTEADNALRIKKFESFGTVRSDSFTLSKEDSPSCVVKKVVCKGIWIVRLLQISFPNKQPRPIVVVSSVASTNIFDDYYEDINCRVEGLSEIDEEVVDIAICEFSDTFICALLLLLRDGSVKVATKKSERLRWSVFAYSAPSPKIVRNPIRVFWTERGRFFILDKSGITLEFSGWTSVLALPWTFSGGLITNTLVSNNKRGSFKKLKRASSMSIDLSSSEEPFNESLGHLSSLCASFQSSVPDHHPKCILENFRQGHLDLVEATLRHISKVISENSTNGRPIQIPPYQKRDPSSNEKNDEPEEDWLNYLEEKLTTSKILNLNPADHLELLSCVNLFRKFFHQKVSGLDPAASKFAVAVETLKIHTRNSLRTDSLRTSEVAWALHSDTQSGLIQHFLEQPNIVWADCRALGVGLWVITSQDCKSLMERLAKAHFLQYDRDPFKCLLFYATLGKSKIASALFKTCKNEKVAQLLAQDFTQERWQTAASKNAYALIEKRRYEDAAAFFILAGKVNEALRVLSKNLEDFQLALFVGRTLHFMNSSSNEIQEAYRAILSNSCLEIALAVKDPWLCSMIYTLLEEREKSITCFKTDFFITRSKHLISKREIDREVYVRQIASREKPKIVSFDPLVNMFLRHVLSRPPFFKKEDSKYSDILLSNQKRTAVFYLTEHLPKLAIEFMDNDERLIQKSLVYAALPYLQDDAFKSMNEMKNSEEFEKFIIKAWKNMNFMQAYFRKLEGSELDGEIIEFCEKKISQAYQSLSSGGILNSKVSARRLTCYSLILNENIERISSDIVRKLASLSAFSGLILSGVMIKHYGLLETLMLPDTFKIGEPLPLSVVSVANRITKEYSDYEEVVSNNSSSTKNWAQNLSRGVLKTLIFENVRNLIPEEVAPSLSIAVDSLVRRVRSDLHNAFGLPELGTSSLSLLIDPLRPFFATSRSFEDFNEQGLWVRLQGSERILKLVGEIANANRFRNKRPYLPLSVEPDHSVEMINATRRGPLSSITLYHNPGEALTGVIISQGFPEYMVVGSVENGPRDVNIRSSLKYRNRTPDGRGLTDTEAKSWNNVYTRFMKEEESSDLNESWQAFLSATATGMKHQHLKSPTSPKHAMEKTKNNLIKNPGTFLSHSKFQLKTSCEKASSPNFPNREVSVSRLSAHPFIPAFVSGCLDGSALLWRVGEERSIGRFQKPGTWVTNSPVSQIRVSPDGYKVITGDLLGRCAMWQVEFAESYPFSEYACSSKAIGDVAFLNLSSIFATCSADGVVALWDTLLPARSCCVASWHQPIEQTSLGANLPISLSCLTFSPQSRCLIAGSDRGTIYSIDVRRSRTAVQVKAAHQKPISALAISPDGYSLGTGSTDGSIKFWSLDDISQTAQIQNLHPVPFSQNQGVSDIAFAPNGALFSCGVDGTVKITYSGEAVG